MRWVAVLIHPPSFPVMMLGQVIASVGSPLTLNIMTKVCSPRLISHFCYRNKRHTLHSACTCAHSYDSFDSLQQSGFLRIDELLQACLSVRYPFTFMRCDILFHSLSPYSVKLWWHDCNVSYASSCNGERQN